MQTFRCSTCGQLLFFENSLCLGCGSPLGYDPEVRLVDVFDPAEHRPCANLTLASCNWLIPVDDPDELCVSCRLTSVRPNDAEVDAMTAFAKAESAKRRLLDQIFALGLPVTDRRVDPHRGVTFELLSSRDRQVITGHEAGTITLDLSESDAAHREFVKQQFGEQYRTVLGHLRHEIGHYFWASLVLDAGRVDEFRELFGDERVSYEEALAAHYAGEGAVANWADSHVSQYATMHPWEDWAETFAHYLHIAAGLSTAGAFGLTVGDPAATAGAEATPRDDMSIGPTIVRWLGLVFALNGVARSIGHDDMYPFVLPAPVIAKLDFVHRAIEACRRPAVNAP